MKRVFVLILAQMLLLSLVLTGCGGAKATEQVITEYGFKITIPGEMELNQHEENSATDFSVFTSVGTLYIGRVGLFMTEDRDYVEVLTRRANNNGTTLRILENGAYFYVPPREDDIVESYYSIQVGDRWWGIRAVNNKKYYNEEALLEILMTAEFPVVPD